jgi:hypothetical protein
MDEDLHVLGGAEAVLAKAVLGFVVGEAGRRGVGAVERRAGGDPEEEAVASAWQAALAALNADDRARASESLFDEHFLTHGGAEILARCLTPDRPNPAELARAWRAQFGGDGDAEALVPVATEFLRHFERELTKRSELRSVLQLAASIRTASAVEELRPRFHEDRYDFRDQLERAQRFVGRGQIFARIEEFAEHNTRGYVRIVGDAGLGKSALAAAIAARFEASAFFFGPRLGGRSPQGCLRHLCAEVILRHELDHEYLPARAGQDPNFFVQVLREATMRSGEPVWVVIDALDEADDHGATVLPETLPAGAFLVVTHRPIDLPVTREAGVPLLRCELRPDDEMQRDDLLQYVEQRLRADRELAARLDEADVTADALAQRSAGNFVYLIYVLADAAGGAATRVGDLPEGLADYYSLFWSGFEAGRRTDRETWRALHRPVLEVLTVAREPVPVDWLADLTDCEPEDVEDLALRDWERFLSRYPDERWSMVHESVADFLRTKLDIPKAHARIAQHFRAPERWGEHDGYASRHLMAHLRAAGELDALVALADDPRWENAQLSADPSGARFLDDLAQVWNTADDGSMWERRLWCLLATTTYNGHSGALPGALLLALVRAGRWSFDQALAAVAQNPVEHLRSGALADLIPHLPSRLLPEARALVRALPPSGSMRARAALAARGTAGDRAALIALVKELAPTHDAMVPMDLYLDAIAGLPEVMRDDLIDVALDHARQLYPWSPGTGAERGQALVLLSKVAAEGLAGRLAEEALGSLDPANNAHAWSIVDAGLTAGPSCRLDVRLAAIRHNIESPDGDAALVARLVETLDPATAAEVARDVAAEQVDNRRAAALMAALPHADENLADEALRLADMVGGESADWLRAGACRRMHMLARTTEAAALAKRITDPDIRLETLIALLKASPESARSDLLAQAIEIAPTSPDTEKRFEAFHALACVAPSERERIELLEAALRAVAEEGYMRDRAAFLERIAPDLPASLLDAAVATTREAHEEDFLGRVDAFQGLGEVCAREYRATMLRAAAEAARQLPPNPRRLCLDSLVPKMAASGLAAEAAEEVRTVPDEKDQGASTRSEPIDSWRAKHLAGLAADLPPAAAREALEEAGRAALIADGPELLIEVAGLALDSRERLVPEAETRVRHIGDDLERLRYLWRLVPLLPPARRFAAVREVLAVFVEDFGPEVGEPAWASLPADSPGQLRALLEGISMGESYWRIPILRHAAAAVPGALLPELLEYLRTAREDDSLLVAVAGSLTARGAVEAGLSTVEGVSLADADPLDVLNVLPHLPEPDRRREQMAALRRAQDADEPWKREDILRALIPQLPLDLLPEAAAIARAGDRPEKSLIAVALRRAELGDLDGALVEFSDFDDEDHAVGLLTLAEHHPDLLRDRTVRAQLQVHPRRPVGELPGRYVERFARAAQHLPLDEAHSVLETILHMLSAGGRAHAISSLRQLAPLLVAVAGEDGARAAADAIRTVTTRWP